MSNVYLDADPEYKALSYTWDIDSTSSTGQDTKVITYSGHEMLVRENLFAALRRLRYSDRLRSLWIDAICINQTDIEEKNNQVALMGSMYASAKEVIIWLGEEEADNALAFDFVLRLKRILEHEGEDSDLALQMLNSKRGPDEIPMSGNRGWPALLGLLEKRWFPRAWIVQEVALTRSAMLVCGDLTLNWKKLFFAFARIRSSRIRALLGLHSYLPAMATLGVIDKVLAMRDSQKSLKLIDPLAFTCCLQATDPRDKIFSLLSLLDFKENETENEKAKMSWSLDYNIPVDELFRKFTAYLILDKRLIDILSLVNHGSHLDEQEAHLGYYLGTSLPKNGKFHSISYGLAIYRIGRYPCNHSYASHIDISGVLFDQIRAVSNVWRTLKSAGLRKNFE